MSISLSPPRPRPTSIWQRQLFIGPKLKLKERQQLYRQWSVLLGAGLNIIDCLDILIGQARPAHIADMLLRLKAGLEGGNSLSDSFAAEKGWFDLFEQQSLRIGEQTGRLAQILEQLAAFYEKRLLLRRKLMQALSYPIVVIVIALGVVAFMLGQVVPMFEDIFSRFDASLPAVTELIMHASRLFRVYFGWLMIAACVIVVCGWWLGKKPFVKLQLAKLLLSIPLIGKLLLELHLARFSTGLAMLLEAKVPLDRALLLLEDMSRFAPLRVRLPAIRQAVVEGDSLGDAVSREKLFPPSFRHMLQVGEKTASLADMLAHHARVTEEAADNKLNQLTQLLEPLLILGLGGLVALILVAMYLPMFELSSVMG